MATVIDGATTEAVLERLGLADTPEPNRAGLGVLYRAWCEHVPFDNVVKRIHLASGDLTPFPNGDPSTFFDLYLRHGTGGTCWPTTLALHGLLTVLGFAARLGSASMRDDVAGRIHSHGTNLVTVDGDELWLDTSMLTVEPIPLARGRATTLDHPFRPVRVEPVDGLWRVHWYRQQFPEVLPCLLLDDDATVAHCQARYEASRQLSPFNTMLTAVTWRDGHTLVVSFGTRGEQDAAGYRHAPLADRPQRDRVLVEEFGYSEEIVERLPDDDP
jgi:N-hydroxyarylamine O-acetyltransferase